MSYGRKVPRIPLLDRTDDQLRAMYATHIEKQSSLQREAAKAARAAAQIKSLLQRRGVFP